MRRALLMLVALVFVTVLAMAIGRLTSGDVVIGEGIEDPTGVLYQPIDPVLRNAGAGIGLLLLGSWLAAQAVKALQIPKITAFLVFGLVAGPSVLGIVGEAEIRYLGFVNDLAIALIGLAAGSEIRPWFLRKYAKTLLIFFGIEVPSVLLAVAALVVFGGPLFGLLEGLSGVQMVAIGLLVGAVAVSNSPAVVIAMLRETKSAGPLSSLCLSLTVCKDLILVVLFAIAMAFADSLLSERVQDGLSTGGWVGIDAELAMYLAQHIGGSIIFGAILGGVMAFATRRIVRNESIFVILLGFGIAVFSGMLHTEPIIVAIVAGLVLENIWPSRTRRLFETVEELSLPVFCVFFALAGAKIDLGILSTMWIGALALVSIRVLVIWGSTHGALSVAGVGPPVRTWLWTGLVPQAGISLALATIVGTTFADRPFGPVLFNLLLAMIAIHELIGPALFKLGLVRSGEVSGGGGPAGGVREAED